MPCQHFDISQFVCDFEGDCALMRGRSTYGIIPQGKTCGTVDGPVDGFTDFNGANWDYEQTPECAYPVYKEEEE